jgi:hypothetical protein
MPGTALWGAKKKYTQHRVAWQEKLAQRPRFCRMGDNALEISALCGIPASARQVKPEKNLAAQATTTPVEPRRSRIGAAVQGPGWRGNAGEVVGTSDAPEPTLGIVAVCGGCTT